MLLLSRAGDGVTVVTWLRCDADAESCRRWRCQVLLATVLLSPIGDGVAEAMLVVP
jgi:hypothetical protein